MNDLAVYESIPTEKLRDRVMDDLVKHYSVEHIDLDEFERRTDLVSKAESRAQLIAQIADLPDLAGTEKRTASRRRDTAQGWSVATGEVRSNDFAVAIFGGSDFKGVWRAPRRLSTMSIFGGTNIDLRKAIVPQEGVTISCLCAFGGTDIVVPPGMRVTTRGIGIFGGFDRANNEVDDPDAPSVIVEGFAVFGGVSVRIRQ
jgi:DUF1707 SHOCT-like domain/Cell wall-active antibiotics response LiaF, C-terminal